MSTNCDAEAATNPCTTALVPSTMWVMMERLATPRPVTLQRYWPLEHSHDFRQNVPANMANGGTLVTRVGDKINPRMLIILYVSV